MYQRAKMGIVFALSFAVLLLVALLSQVVGVTTAVRGLYPFIGLVVVGVVYWQYQRADDKSQYRDVPLVVQTLIRDGRGTRLFGIISSATIALIVFFQSQLVLLPILPLLYGIIAGQLLLGGHNKSILFELPIAFALSPAAKYVSTGFYFGDGDIAPHTYAIEQLLVAGDTGAIPLPRYSEIAGYHVLSGTLSLITGMPAYDSLMAIGTMIFVVLMIFTFLLVHALTQRFDLAIGATAAFACIPFGYRYASYVYPQAVAAVVGMLALYALYRANRWEMNVISFVLLAALVMIHHATLILFYIIISGLVFLHYIFNTKMGSHANLSLPSVVAGFITAVTLWVFAVEDFILAVGGVTQVLLSGIALGGGQSTTSVHALGMTPPDQSLSSALNWLLYPDGAYYALLVAWFVFGILVLDRYQRSSWKIAPLIAIGISSSLVLFKLPLQNEFLVRLRLPLGFFAVFVVCFAIAYVFTDSNAARRNWPVAAVMLILVASFAPFAVSDTTNALNPEVGDPKQTEFTDREIAVLGEISRHTNDHGQDQQVSTVYSTYVGFSRYGYFPNRQIDVSNQAITTGPGLFVYQNRWHNHRLTYSGDDGSFNQFYLSEAWLRAAIQRENVVYDSGQEGILWKPGRGNISASSEPGS